MLRCINNCEFLLRVLAPNDSHTEASFSPICCIPFECSKSPGTEDKLHWVSNLFPNLRHHTTAKIYVRALNVAAEFDKLGGCRYHDAQAKCATMASTGTVSASSVSRPQYVDYYYTNANSLNTQMCYGYFQATYTSDGGAFLLILWHDLCSCHKPCVKMIYGMNKDDLRYE